MSNNTVPVKDYPDYVRHDNGWISNTNMSKYDKILEKRRLAKESETRIRTLEEQVNKLLAILEMREQKQ